MQPRHRWQHQNETDVSDEEWIDPLRQFHRTIVGAPLADQFNVEYFLVGPRLLRPGLPDMHLYKHMDTGRTLAVDSRGAAYRYLPPNRDGLGGHWKKHRSITDALADLELHSVMSATNSARGDSSRQAIVLSRSTIGRAHRGPT